MTAPSVRHQLVIGALFREFLRCEEKIIDYENDLVTVHDLEGEKVYTFDDEIPVTISDSGCSINMRNIRADLERLTNGE